MKVNPNRETAAAARITSAKKSAVESSQQVATEKFPASAELTAKLSAVPDVRADVVARAKRLIADPNYPDAKTIESIARKLRDEI
jgi:hypothetical protein